MSGTVLLIKRRCLFLRNFFIFYKLKVVKVGKRCTAILIVGWGWMWSGKAAIVYGMRYKRCRIKLKFSCLSWGNVLPAVTEKTTFFFRPNRETLSIKSCNYLLTNKIALGICLPGPDLPFAKQIGKVKEDQAKGFLSPNKQNCVRDLPTGSRLISSIPEGSGAALV